MNQQQLMDEMRNNPIKRYLDEPIQKAIRPATSDELTGMILMLRSRGYKASFESND